VDLTVNKTLARAKAKAKARHKARKRKARRQAPAIVRDANAPPRVRLADATVETLQVMCAEILHPVHIVRRGVHVKAIITPCGVRATLAAYHLGGDTCGYFVLLLRDFLSDASTTRSTKTRPGLVDELGHITRVCGDHIAYQTRDNWRVRRAQLANEPSWDRNKLTLPALEKLVARAAGPGAKVNFSENEIRVSVPEHDTESRYLYIVDSWGLGGGPGVPAIGAALKRWSKRIQEAVIRTRPGVQRRRA
jgi:hypothetical protein